MCIQAERVNNMKGNRNILTLKFTISQGGVKGSQNTKFCAILLISVMLTGIFSLSPAISMLMNDVIIRSTGSIFAHVTANSGSAEDIQAAVDEVAAMGGGVVYIPEGTFNFVEVGEPWRTVNIPAGINLFGAPTERDANGQVIEWKTVLVMPYEAPASSTWFSVQGTGAPNVAFRFSDIKLVGWRFFNSSSKTMYTGVSINQVQNFRVDHCYFQDIAGSAIFAGSSPMRDYNHGVISGVIDHNILNNTYGDPGLMHYEETTVGYGIFLRRWACAIWDYDITNVIGHYNNYTIFIEDNYFSKWRHCVSSNDGLHYIFRYNVVEGDYGIGSVDAHGSYADDVRTYAVGTRAIEVYNNTFKNPDTTWTNMPWAINLRGGSGIIFSNTLEGYYALMDLNNDYGNIAYVPQCHINQTYIWNNNLGGGTLIKYNYDNTENVHYFLRAPNLGQDGFEYTPFPHPLTLEAAP